MGKVTPVRLKKESEQKARDSRVRTRKVRYPKTASAPLTSDVTLSCLSSYVYAKPK